MGTRMIRYNLSKTFFIISILCLFSIGCDNGTQNTEDGILTGDQINLLKGTTWLADSGSLFIEFPNGYSKILFKNNQNYGMAGGNLNGNVTLGNFRLSSYDGETMKLLDYDNSEVAFSVIISESKMTVDGLSAIQRFQAPYERKDFQDYNRTYTKKESIEN